MDGTDAATREGRFAGSGNKCVLVGIVGGSGSGKSWLAEQLADYLQPTAARLSLDDFYQDRSSLSAGRRARINFDHPRAIDWKSLERVLRDFGAGQPAKVPCYDFATHCRAGSKSVEFKPILLVEGLWLLRRPSVRRLFAFTIFLECPPRLRLQRRLERDLASRGRSAESIRMQFRTMVEPMHRKFVASQIRYADVTVRTCSTSEVRQLGRFIADLADVRGRS
jgi:uridine kinase